MATFLITISSICKEEEEAALRFSQYINAIIIAIINNPVKEPMITKHVLTCVNFADDIVVATAVVFVVVAVVATVGVVVDAVTTLVAILAVVAAVVNDSSTPLKWNIIGFRC